jgi:hypothetical protein
VDDTFLAILGDEISASPIDPADFMGGLEAMAESVTLSGAENLVFMAGTEVARKLAFATALGGERLFPNMGLSGGRIIGVDVLGVVTACRPGAWCSPMPRGFLTNEGSNRRRRCARRGAEDADRPGGRRGSTGFVVPDRRARGSRHRRVWLRPPPRRGRRHPRPGRGRQLMALDVDRLTDALLDGTKLLIAKEVEPLKARIAELEAERVSFKGIWQSATRYKRGDLATRDGALWYCTRDETADTPGQGRRLATGSQDEARHEEAHTGRRGDGEQPARCTVCSDLRNRSRRITRSRRQRRRD